MANSNGTEKRLLDANVILRYLLQDNDKLSPIATDIIDNTAVYTTTEVIAEVIYVLIKVYDLPRTSVAERLYLMFTRQIILHDDFPVMTTALQIFLNTKMDFVDCVLISECQNNHHTVVSFDKKVNQYIGRLG